MKRLICISIFLISCCERDIGRAQKEVQNILGESVVCLPIPLGEGFLCRGSKTKIHYVCPRQGSYDCFTTLQFRLVEPTAEAPNP